VAEVASRNENHRRIERIMFWDWITLAAFVLVGWPWFLYRTGICPGDVGRVALAVCRYSFVVPTVLGIVLVLALPLTIMVLVTMGREGGPADAPPGLRGAAGRMAHGYRTLEVAYRKRVRRVLLLTSAAAGAFAGQLIFTYLDAPALGALLLGVAPPLIVLAVNRWLIGDASPEEAADAATADRPQEPELEARLLAGRRRDLGRGHERRLNWALALSGGGIRSATFSLGVLQAIARTRSPAATVGDNFGDRFRASMLSQFDYLSTVSGGGYAGAFLCSLFMPGRLRRESNTKQRAADDAVAVLEVSAPGRIRSDASYEGTAKLRAPLAWLRENGRYLVPTGVGDAVYAAALGLRGWVSLHVVIGTVLLALFASIALARHSLVTIGAWLGDSLGSSAWVIKVLRWLQEWEITRLVAALDGKVWTDQIWFSSLFIAALLLLVVWAVPCGIAYWMTYQQRTGRSDIVNRGVVGMLGSALVLGLLLAVDRASVSGDLVLEAALSSDAGAWTPRQLFIAALIVEVVLAWLAYTWFARRLPLASEQRAKLTRALATALVATASLAALGLIETLGQSLYLWATREGGSIVPVAGSAGSAGVFIWLVKKGAAALTRSDQPSFLSRIPLTTLAGVAGFIVFIVIAALWVTAANALLWAGVKPDTGTFFDVSKVWLLSALVVCALALALLAGQYPSFINLSSLQSFYSARLTRAYLGATNGDRFQDGRPDLLSVAEPLPGDTLALDEFYTVDSHHRVDRLTTVAPVHIINVTINKTVDPAEQLVQRDRKGQPLAVLPFGFAIDSDSTWRYRANMLGSEIARPLTLGQWIGTSGAAFSTGIGRETSLGMSLLMGMANVRLGLWWHSGRGERKFSTFTRGFSGVIGAIFRTQTYLSYELRARFYGLRRTWQYLSDGGHFENTAIFELLRPHRNVELIVASDNGADPHYGFGDLANLIRLARIDLDVEIALEDVAKKELALAGVFGMPKDFARDLKDGTKEWKPPFALLLKATRPQSPRPFTTWIVLLKPALHADAPADVRQYARDHAMFPQEPTTDQFFNEAQWESYRALGLRCAERVLDGVAWGALMAYIRKQTPAGA
jgi:hypothetical protein